jgi:hypothetical protein
MLVDLQTGKKRCLRAKNPSQMGRLKTLFGGILIPLQIQELAPLD